MECLSPIGEYHLRNTSHDFELVCFLARRGNVHILFLQRLSKCARTNYTNSWLTSISESLRVHSGCYLSLGYSRSRSVCPNHTVRHQSTQSTCAPRFYSAVSYCPSLGVRLHHGHHRVRTSGRRQRATYGGRTGPPTRTSSWRFCRMRRDRYTLRRSYLLQTAVLVSRSGRRFLLTIPESTLMVQSSQAGSRAPSIFFVFVPTRMLATQE